MSASSDRSPSPDGWSEYEARYRWRGPDLWLAVPAACVAAMAVADTDRAAWSLFAAVPVVVAASFPLLRVMQMRQVAVRVDAEGMTFGWPRWPWSRASSTVTVPWADITAVVLWGHTQRRRVQVIGLVRRDGADPLPLPPPLRSVEGFGSDALAPYARVLDRLSYAVRVRYWRPDPDRLTAAVRHHAPLVDVVDGY